MVAARTEEYGFSLSIYQPDGSSLREFFQQTLTEKLPSRAKAPSVLDPIRAG